MTERKLKSTKIIILSSTAILVSIFVLVFSNLYFLKMTNTSLAAIDTTYNGKLDIILRMTYIVRERSMIMLTMYLDDDVWSVDDHYMKYNKLALDFIRLRDQLIGLGLTEAEQQELDKAFVFIRQTEPLQNEIVERIRSGGDKMLRTDISNKDLPLEYRLLDIFSKLSNKVRENTDQARHQARQDYTRSVFIVAMVSMLVALAIIVLMYRSLRKIQTIEIGLINETTSLSWDATHDPLTNIFNRRWLRHKIEQLNSGESDRRTIHSIIYLDLDDFKPVNDRYGHAAGDRYLIGFCREIEHYIRHNDVFARIGGDEFVILLENCDQDKAKAIADNILANIASFSVDFEGSTLSTNCSIGLLGFKPGTNKLDDLLQQADALCYEAKRLGKNCVYSKKQTI